MKLNIHVSRETQIFIGLTLLYLLLSFILPASHATKTTYHLDSLQYKYLLFTVRLPIVALWVATFYSYRWLARYAARVADTNEGPYFDRIARGIGWIAWGFPIPALLSTALNAIANGHSGFLSTALIITGYLYAIVPLVVFSYIGAGSHALSRLAHVQLTSKHIRALMITLVLFSVLFCFLVASRLHSTHATDSFNGYYLPNWLVWLTLVVPYLYAAFIGLLAVLELVLIARRTPGIIYKQALQLLAAGLVLVIVMLVSLQYFRSVIPRTGHLTIGTALFTTYLIYGVGIAGSLLVAAGAKRLKKIEDA